VQVSIANLRIPEVPSRAQAIMKDKCSHISAALGYLILHLDLFANILAAPVLHEGAFLGLHSSVWMPQTFWKRQAESGQQLTLSGLPSEAISSSFIAGSAAAWASIALDSQDSGRYVIDFKRFCVQFIVDNGNTAK
jgi:hypothetical protein